MKLKYVLFSGLLLSVGFTACTNEDFTEVTAPVSTDGIALDEVTINVGNGADTKAVLGSDYKPTWEEGDLLGAARFHSLKADPNGYDYEKEEVIGVEPAFDAFSANHTLELTAGAGTNDGTFTTQDSKGLEAGAHVLYYPQREDITPTKQGALPVTIQSYDIDCNDPMWNLNKNMFAYSAVKFLPGNKSTNDYTLRQVPVLYNLYFEASEHLTQNLDGPITIQHIVVEAWNADKKSVVTELGEVVVDDENTVPSPADYNNDDLNKFIKYQDNQTDVNVDHLFYNVKNSNNGDYQLMTKGVKTVKGFKFMALPWSGKAEIVIIKIVTDKGTFTKTYKAGDKNEKGVEYLKEFNAQATAEGGQISLNVVLNTIEADEVIYTADQMKDRLAKIEAGKIYHWILGEPIDVSDTDMKLAKDAVVCISRYPLTVKSLDTNEGRLIVLNDLTVKGDVNIDSNAKGFETMTLTTPTSIVGTGTPAIVGLGDGILTVGGKLTIGGGTGGDVKIKLAKAGDIQINTSGIATLTGIDAVPADGVEETVVGNINNEGKLTLKNIVISEDKTLTITKQTGSTVTPTLTIGDNAVVNNGTITNNGVFAVNGKEFTNNGTFNHNGKFGATASGSKFVNAAGGDLNINADVVSAWAENSVTVGLTIENQPENVADKLPAAEITVAAGKTLNANNPNYPVVNDGVININGLLAENAPGTIKQQNTRDARIYINKGATASFNGGTSAITKGYVVKDAAVTSFTRGGLSQSLIAMNATSKTIDAVKLDTDANTIFLNGNFEADATFFSNKYFILTGGTITFTEDASVSGAGVYVEGNVTFTTNVAAGIELKLGENGSQDLTVYADGKLTLDKKVKLTADAVVNVVVENGGDLVYNAADNIGNNITIVMK